MCIRDGQYGEGFAQPDSKITDNIEIVKTKINKRLLLIFKYDSLPIRWFESNPRYQ